MKSRSGKHSKHNTTSTSNPEVHSGKSVIASLTTLIDRDQVPPSRRPIVGVIPAGGYATRVSPLPCSKELYPIGFHYSDESQGCRPKVVCQYLLERMRRAGVTAAYIVLREGKWDIPAYLGNGAMDDMDLAYLVTKCNDGPAYTVDQAYPFIQDKLVAFGFPDILFEPGDGFAQIRDRQDQTDADIVLGLFRVDRTRSDDRVIFDDVGHVKLLIPGPTVADVDFTWNIAIWTPTFTKFLHMYLNESQGMSRQQTTMPKPEVTMGVVLKAALDQGLRLEVVRFAEDWYLDIGTPDNLVKAVRRFSS